MNRTYVAGSYAFALTSCGLIRYSNSKNIRMKRLKEMTECRDLASVILTSGYILGAPFSIAIYPPTILTIISLDFVCDNWEKWDNSYKELIKNKD